VTDDELREVVSQYWTVDEIRPARLHGLLSKGFSRCRSATYGGAERPPIGAGWLLSDTCPDRRPVASGLPTSACAIRA